MNGVKKFNLAAVAMLVLLGLVAAGCASTKEPRLRGFNNDEVETLMAEQRARMNMGDPVVKPLQDLGALERHGDSMGMRGEYAAAYFEYGRAFKMAKEQADQLRLRRKLAVTSLRGGNFVEAEKQFAALTKMDSGDGFAWQGLGLSLLSQARPDDAMDALDKAVSLDPKLWKAQNGRGIILNRQGKSAQALTAFEQALKYQRNSAALYNNQGLAYMMTGQLSQAADSFQKALRINPGYVQANNNLALTFFKQGKTEMALPLFERTLGAAKAHNNLGCLLAWQGHYEKAAQMFNSAVEISPTYYKLAADHYEEVRYKADTAVPVKKGEFRGNTSTMAAVKSTSAPDQPKAATPEKKVAVKVTASTPKDAKAELINRAAVVQSINSLRPTAPKAKTVVAQPAAEPPRDPEKKAETKAPDAEAEGHFIQVASMSSEARAQSCVKSWSKRGVQGKVEQWQAANGKTWYRVLLGPFNTKAEAAAKAEKLKGQGRIREFLLVDRGTLPQDTPTRAMASL